MIETACDIVQIPGGGLAALMPLPDVPEKHWVAVRESGTFLHSNGRIHRPAMSWRIASMPWDEGWKALGQRDVVVEEPEKDFDLGGFD